MKFSLVPWLVLLVAVGFSTAGRAERGDRSKPLEVLSDGAPKSPGAVMDLSKRTVVLTGNVVITQGTMQIKADRVDLRESPDGSRTAVAMGANGKPASYRQKRDGVNEFMEATADRIEYDSRSNQVRFVGDAHSRRLVGDTVADQATAAVIVYDSVAETVSLQGGASEGASASASAPSGRTRLVLMPREAPAEAAPASAPASSAAPTKPGEPR